ncbi:hypothetical protein DMB38_25570 [Streptomyces sp. WAC 06738]|nr:hypothetical protein DMB38_25570 [Streptomyces sp. WAC 06738]
MLVRTRIQLGGPILLVSDNVRIHLTADLREFFAVNTDWLTMFQLPASAQDPNRRKGDAIVAETKPDGARHGKHRNHR